MKKTFNWFSIYELFFGRKSGLKVWMMDEAGGSWKEAEPQYSGHSDTVSVPVIVLRTTGHNQHQPQYGGQWDTTSAPVSVYMTLWHSLRLSLSIQDNVTQSLRQPQYLGYCGIVSASVSVFRTRGHNPWYSGQFDTVSPSVWVMKTMGHNLSLRLGIPNTVTKSQPKCQYWG